MKHVKLFEQFVADIVNENAFSNFSSEEKKAWKKAENKIGDTYFVPFDETEYKKMMRFLGSKNWKFWNANNVPGFSSETVNPNKLPAWKSGIGFKLGGTRTGHTYVIPTEITPLTQGARFAYDKFSKVIEDMDETVHTFESSEASAPFYVIIGSGSKYGSKLKKALKYEDALPAFTTMMNKYGGLAKQFGKSGVNIEQGIGSWNVEKNNFEFYVTKNTMDEIIKRKEQFIKDLISVFNLKGDEAEDFAVYPADAKGNYRWGVSSGKKYLWQL